MKTFDLKAYGVSEMSALEARAANGGERPIASYLTDEQIAAGGEAIGTAFGWVCGFVLSVIGIAR